MGGVRHKRLASIGHVPAFLVCALALGLSDPAGVGMAAATPPAPAAGRDAGWSIRAALAGATTLPQGHFAYALPAGAQIADALVVHSTRRRALHLSFYGADLAAAGGGGVAPLQQGTRMRGVGAWLRVHATGTVPPGATVRVPFQLDVPPDTVPGAYDGAVVAAGLTGATTHGLAVAFRTALIIHVAVVGTVRPHLSAGRLRAANKTGIVHFTLPVVNRGNVNLSLHGLVRILDHRKRELADVALGPTGLYVVPGGRALLHGVWTAPTDLRGATAAPILTTEIGDTAGPTYRGPQVALPRRMAAQWALVRGLGAAAAAAVVWWLTDRRRVARERGAQRQAGTAPGDGGG